MVVNAPTATFAPRLADGLIEACGERPVSGGRGTNQRSITRAQARYGLATRT